jgi:SEC-C motif-containing protein
MTGPCPCGSARPYGDCCGPLLAGRPAATAQDLMRSRYTAYGLKDAAYLLATWHPRTRPKALDFDGDATEWLGLAILRQAGGGAADSEGLVEFAATCRQGGAVRRLRESSRFVKEGGAWLYLDGALRP